MKITLTQVLTAGLFAASAPLCMAQAAPQPALSEINQPNADLLSIRNEIKLAVQSGNKYLKSTQHKDGYWYEADLPAFTGLAVYAAMGDPNRTEGEIPAHVKKGYDFIMTKVQKDGGIYGKGLANYNTSLCIMALVASGDDTHVPAILNARNFLIGLQDTRKIGDDGKPNIMKGGVGYGGTYPHSDLSNTHLALHAIRTADIIALDGKHGKQKQLDWESAINFISSCQNLQSTNKHEKADNDGSFVYFPGNSKAGTHKDASGKERLKGYGSMSYAGLLSLVHAKLDENDPRVVAVKKWLGENYTLDENPGVGEQGIYYYYHVMAKALTAANVNHLKLKDGSTVNWRKQLAERLLKQQQEDGSWVNKNSRWLESNKDLVTSYAVLTLQQIYYSIPENK